MVPVGSVAEIGSAFIVDFCIRCGLVHVTVDTELRMAFHFFDDGISGPTPENVFQGAFKLSHFRRDRHESHTGSSPQCLERIA